jgi:hypothetical protein
MSSCWIKARPTASGTKRHRVEYRLGGRESKVHYGGSFRTRKEALARKAWITGELAALRVPDIDLLVAEQTTVPTFAQAAEAWREARVDVAEGTRVLHRVALARALPRLGMMRIDEIDVPDVVDVVTVLHAAGAKRETIRQDPREPPPPRFR